ncbi:MAG: hypothetical protein ACJAVK_002836 [Akkermansiaceae bacterium]|jgi:hypothetical protein
MKKEGGGFKSKERVVKTGNSRSRARLVWGVLAMVAVGFAIYGINRLVREDSSNDYVAPTVDVVDPRIPMEKKASWQEIDDPSKDGWDTEVFTGEAMTQLKALGKLLSHHEKIEPAAVEGLIGKDFSSGPLRPGNLVTVFNDQHMKVERSTSLLVDQDFRIRSAPGSGEEFAEAEGLVEVLRAAAAPFFDATEVRFKAKVFRVSAGADEMATRQYFTMSGRTKDGMLEQHATWDIGWARGEGDELPRLRWLRVVEFEEVLSSQESGGLFVDCTASALGGNAVYAEQFLKGMNHWFQRIQDRSPLELFGNPGLAVGDVNGDGLDDLYVCQESGLPNRLFVGNPDGTATEQAASWGVDWLQSSRGALLVDLDNDGDQDLAVAIHGGVVVAENNGSGRFLLRDVLTTTDDTMSLSAVDYDLDGKLDLYVCGYFQSAKIKSEDSGLGGSSSGFVVHDANNGGSNTLFRNRISANDWQFDDVTDETGLSENNSRWSLAASWEDFDNDGDQDLYIANDYGRDNLYRNDPGSGNGKRRFVDISNTANVEDSATGMSIAWGDYDRDGRMDAFVSNMWSSAGNRIAFQEKFLENSTEEHRRRIQRLARGNTLLKNQGDGAFLDQNGVTGVEMGRWAWGSHFVDMNNDGWEDIVVSNGYITTDDTGDL